MNYQKTFDRNNDFKIVVGTLRRSKTEGNDDQAYNKLSNLQLPEGWMDLVPGPENEPVQFVRMTMGVDLVNNIIPSDDGVENDG